LTRLTSSAFCRAIFTITSIMLSKQAIEEYREIYKKEYSKDISYEDAKDQGERLVGLFQILLQMDKK